MHVVVVLAVVDGGVTVVAEVSEEPLQHFVDSEISSRKSFNTYVGQHGQDDRCRLLPPTSRGRRPG